MNVIKDIGKSEQQASDWCLASTFATVAHATYTSSMTCKPSATPDKFDKFDESNDEELVEVTAVNMTPAVVVAYADEFVPVN